MRSSGSASRIHRSEAEKRYVDKVGCEGMVGDAPLARKLMRGAVLTGLHGEVGGLLFQDMTIFNRRRHEQSPRSTVIPTLIACATMLSSVKLR